MCVRPAGRIVVDVTPGDTSQLQGTATMHAFITGHLADARIADIERELAHDAHRAQIRAARRTTTTSRGPAVLAAVRRLIARSPAGDTGPAAFAAPVATPRGG
jgi:hypothetical protein